MKKAVLVSLLVVFASLAFAQSPDELAERATTLYQQKHFLQAADLYAKALQAGSDNASIAYNAACSYALAGDREKGLSFLTRAVEMGFNDADHLKKDSDLDSLHADPRWQQLFTVIEKKAKDREMMWDSPSIATGEEQELTEDQKIAGLSKFWSEVKYNFAYPEKLVALDWDRLYLSYIPKVRAAQNTVEYYEVLQELCAKLQDGHSNIYFPRSYYNNVIGRPALRTRLMENRVMVVDVWDPELKTSGLTPGAEVVSINGLPARQYAEKFVIPYQSASTPQDLATRTYEYFLFSGPISETLKVEFDTPKGKKISAVVRRKNAEQRKALLPKPAPFEFRILPGNIAYVALNAFDDMTAADEYIRAFSEISKSDAMIIDVRANGGGNSGVGYRVLATLVDQPFLGSRWATRDYRPSFRAWGRPDRMYSPEPERYPNDTEHRYEKPVIVLSSGRTYSAAEDFLVAFDTSKRGTIIGEPSGGSTGQPLFFKLPGGGSARVCSKKDTYADGKPFVGSGIQPQIVVHPKVADFRTGKDTVLEAAIAELQKKLAQ